MKFKRTLMILTILVIMVTSLSAAAVDDGIYKEKLNALSSKYSELEKQQSAILKEINKAKSEKDKQVAKKSSWIIKSTVYDSRLIY